MKNFLSKPMNWLNMFIAVFVSWGVWLLYGRQKLNKETIKDYWKKIKKTFDKTSKYSEL